MKLCRYGAPGNEKPGIVDKDGVLRDLSEFVDDIVPGVLSKDGLERLASIAPESLPVVTGAPRMGYPVSGISKFIAIGLNYRDHAEEAGLAIPLEPIIFLKAVSSISGPHDDIVVPRHSTKLDWELELGVVIGKQASYVTEDEALDHVAGYCVVNDVSERAFQMQSSQWDKGKGCDTFGPIGPWLVTKDEVPNPQDLDMWLDVNGVRRQSGNTKTMIFGVKKLVAYCSQYMTLMPGDVITTGTPPGVGMGIKPQAVYLNPGDVVTLSVQGLGMQRQVVVK